MQQTMTVHSPQSYNFQSLSQKFYFASPGGQATKSLPKYELCILELM